MNSSILPQHSLFYIQKITVLHNVLVHHKWRPQELRWKCLNAAHIFSKVSQLGFISWWISSQHMMKYIVVDNTDLSGNPSNPFPSVSEECEADKLKCNMIPLRFLWGSFPSRMDRNINFPQRQQQQAHWGHSYTTSSDIISDALMCLFRCAKNGEGMTSTYSCSILNLLLSLFPLIVSSKPVLHVLAADTCTCNTCVLTNWLYLLKYCTCHKMLSDDMFSE